MFANVLRSQARFGLLQAARVAVPATRSLSSLIASRAAAPTATQFAVRAFSSTPRAAAFDRPDRPRNPPSETLFVGNVPWDATKEDIARIFSDFGAIEGEVRLPVGYDGRSRGFAHVSFRDPASAIAAVNSANEEPLHLNGRDLILDYATSKTGSAAAPLQPSNKIYFANFEQGERALRDLLGEFEGDILSVFTLRDGNTGAALSNGFVEFTSIDIATEAIDKFNGTELESGARLAMSYARPKKERSTTDRREVRGGNRGGDRRPNHYTNRGYDSSSRREDY